MTHLDPSLDPSPTTPPAGFDPGSTLDSEDVPEKPIIVRVIVHQLTADQTFSLLVAEWADGKTPDPALTDSFIARLANKRLLQSEVQKLTLAIDRLPPEGQTLAIELVAGGAFTRRELKEPERIITYFARPDWTEIVAAWRESQLLEIGQVIQGIEAARRRKEKRTATPLTTSPANGRGTRDELVAQLKVLLPRTLRDWATDFAEGLRALASDPIVSMDAEALAAAVKRRRVGTGTKICHRTIGAGLPHLVQHGFVVIEGNKVRIRPGALA